MPDSSVIAACMTRYDSLSAAAFGGTRPPIFFDEAPQTYNSAQLRPPFVVLKDGGLVPSFEFEWGAMEASALSFEVYAETLASVDTCVEAIKYGGGTITAGSGFDGGTLPSLAAGRRSVRVFRTKETRFREGFGHTGALVHRCRLEYAVTLQRSA
jgi:hypothetical protein